MSNHTLCQSTHIKFLLRQLSLFNQMVSILAQSRGLLANLLVHERLCEHWFINLVVAIAPVANLKTPNQRRVNINVNQCLSYLKLN